MDRLRNARSALPSLRLRPRPMALSSPLRRSVRSHLRSPRHPWLAAAERLEDRSLLAAGALDLSFSGDGIVVEDTGAQRERAEGVSVLSDGKILVVGWATPFAPTPPGSIALFRYSPDGTPDATFGTNGRVL